MTLLDNRYKVLKKLASGGFGATFLATDTRVPSQRHCVVKQLKPIDQDPSFYAFAKERFNREAVVLEELGHNHPQIPQLYAYFEENSQFYLVQEYIQGETLRQQMKRLGPWAETDVRKLLGQLLAVLTYIHHRGIIHRDIKPSNIILRPEDALPVLIDFGAVKEALNSRTLKENQSEASVVIGTSGFMPPEQTLGRPVFSSDLYALSLTAIYCLTGKSPSKHEIHPMTGEILWQRTIPEINPALEQVLTQAIRPALQDRFITAADMAQALAHSGSVPFTPSRATAAPSQFSGSMIGSLPDSGPTKVARPEQHVTLQKYAPQGHDLSESFTQGSGAVSTQQKASQNFTWVLFGLLLVAIATISALVTLMFQNRSLIPVPSDISTETLPDDIIPTESETPAISPPETSSEPEPEFTPDRDVSPGPFEPEVPKAEIVPEEIEPPTPEIEVLPIDTAKATVEQFYSHISAQSFSDAQALMSPSLANLIDPDFFAQFQQVSVENLQVTHLTAETIELIGQNSYLYPDGSSQQEERTFTIQRINGTPKIVESEFIRVIQPRVAEN